MVQSFEVQLLLNSRKGDLFSKRSLQILDLLTLQILSPILQVGLEDLHSLVFVHLGPIPNPLLSHHGLTVDSLGSIDFFLGVVVVVGDVIVIDSLMLLFFLLD